MISGKLDRDRKYRNNRSKTPHKRLWFRTVPFNEEEHYAFLSKCELDGVRYPARKLRELALQYAGYPILDPAVKRSSKRPNPSP